MREMTYNKRPGAAEEAAAEFQAEWGDTPRTLTAKIVWFSGLLCKKLSRAQGRIDLMFCIDRMLKDERAQEKAKITAQLSAANARIAELEQTLFVATSDRDEWEDFISSLATELGCEARQAKYPDHRDCIRDCIAELEAENEGLKRRAEVAEEVLAIMQRVLDRDKVTGIEDYEMVGFANWGGKWNIAAAYAIAEALAAAREGETNA